MKKTSKLLVSALLFAFAFSLMAGCGKENGDGVKNNPPTPSVSANEIINQSVESLENMMDIEKNTQTVQATAFTAPNYNVDYAHERLSVLRGSGIALYFTQYLANNDFENDKVYVDTVSAEGMTLSFYAKKAVVENGVHVSLEMHQANSVNPLQVYFEYDFAAQKPSKTTIVSATDQANGYNLAVAQFDYSAQIAYSYNFYIASTDTTAIKTALTQKTFHFETFTAYNVESYVFAKLYADTNTIESYGYRTGSTDEINATSEQVSALYASIYDAVKNTCTPVALLDTSTVTEKVYYIDMYSYGSSRVMQIQ